MKPPEVRKYLFDIVQACEALREFTAGRTLHDYLHDRLLRSGVERQFEIIGEALNQARQLDPSLETQITHARRFVGFRNVLIHRYSSISSEVVWGVIEGDLPNLEGEVSRLLNEPQGS